MQDCCVAIVKPFITVFDEVEAGKQRETMPLIQSVLDPLISTAIVDQGECNSVYSTIIMCRFLQMYVFDGVYCDASKNQHMNILFISRKNELLKR